MNEKRAIRENEKILIEHLLTLAALSTTEYPIGGLVEEYEGGRMGSISFGDGDATTYSGDLIAVEYIDSDEIPVVITLTQDTNNQLLDLDFWKEDFSKLLVYPIPEKVSVKNSIL